MKIASWNVNSVNARLPNIVKWLESASPDVLLLQELKSMEEKFPFKELEEAGYNCAVNGQKSWNGVAILSKHPIEDVTKELDGEPEDEQARYIEATINGVRVASIYLPNGNPVDTEKYPYKLRWMDRLYNRAKELLELDTPVILGGDYNIIPEEKDAWDISKWEDDALYLLDSRKKFRAILILGYTDAFRINNTKPEQFSFWDYQAGAWPKNNGIRIDHFLTNSIATDMIVKCEIDKEPRGEEKASDHTPIVLEIKK